MTELDLLRMQAEPSAWVGLGAILGIARQRMAQIGHVDANLIAAAGLQVEL